jgi:ElaB/YqjD/DUF883 family membrane-anchored ribosome-binding protein
MADNLRVERKHPDAVDARTTVPRDQTIIETETVVPAHPDRAEPLPDDPEMARAEIEHTRSRMSETIDEIEDVLSRKKERLQSRLDVLAPVRENALAAFGIALGAGILLGILTGGGDDDEDERMDLELEYDADLELLADSDSAYWEQRAELWESRARRLLRIAREQETEIETMRHGGRRSLFGRERELETDEYDQHDDPDDSSFMDDVRGAVIGTLTSYLRRNLPGQR